MGQERILLSLVETMHFINEQDGLASGDSIEAGAIYRFADFLDAGQHSRNLNEIGIKMAGHQTRQRRFADAGRPPQNHRVRLAGIERQPQRSAGAKQVGLSNDLVQAGRTQALC